ncbi:phage Gp37/Gp68 family protein [Acidovorax facilis]|uniref:phage Gp37/Gp68 family protein n=1 Tax=Acidovorax facilis TaxID=12917 RepID=UPI003CF0070C
MSTNTTIEWCDHTFNPWEGCQKMGPGCDNCYAEARNVRFAGGTAVNWGPGAPRRRTSAANWNLPKRWNAQADAFMTQHGRRQRVFCASLADVFDNAVDPQWRADLFKLIADTPNLDWLLLTKRIGNVARMIPFGWQDFRMPPNIWIGATIVNQAELDRDLPKLYAVPARVRFLSIEPLLGPVTLDYWPIFDEHEKPLLHWVIVGGESGPNARPMHPDWARSLRDQCEAAGVPFLFKQWGEFNFSPITLSENRPHICAIDPAGEDWAISVNNGKVSHLGPQDGMWTLDKDGLPTPGLVEWHCVGKKAAGRQLDGRTWDGFPP